MTKIPVLKTVAYAYAFTFSHLGVIVGLIWIPMLLLTVIGFLAQSTAIDARITYETTKNAAALGPGFLWVVLVVVLGFLANAMMLVPTLQQALGLRQGHAIAHFAIGPPEWRMFGGYALLVGVVFFALIVLSIAAFVLAAILGTVLGGPAAVTSLPAPVAVVLGLVTLVLMVLAMAVFLRLALFIPAVTLLEEKIDLVRGWTLGQGNTWRIFAICLLTLFTGTILEDVLLAAVFGWQAVVPNLSDLSGEGPHMLDQLNLARKMLPVQQAIGFLLAPLAVGLNAGVVAAAYRTLVPSQSRAV